MRGAKMGVRGVASCMEPKWVGEWEQEWKWDKLALERELDDKLAKIEAS